MRTCASIMGMRPWSSDPPPVTSTWDTGGLPSSEAKYWMEFLISSTSSCMLGCATRSADWIWADSVPNWYLMVSASTIGTSSDAEMAAVVAFPPEPMVRTNCGRPPWWTTTTVSPAPMETMASDVSWASVPSLLVGVPTARTRAEEIRSTPSTVRPAFSTASMTPFTRSTCAAATRIRRILTPSSLV